MNKILTAYCESCNQARLFRKIGSESRLDGTGRDSVYICSACQWTQTASRLQANQMQADAVKHEQLLDLAGEKIATLRFVLSQIRDLSKAGRLDEIFTLANRALEECK